MATVAAVAAIGTLLVGGYSAKVQYDASKDAKKIGDANAARALEESNEATRRLEKQQSLVLSEAKARAFAGGSDTSQSTKAYLNEMKTTFSKEVDWIKKSGASAAYIATMEGKYKSQMGKAGAFGTLASSGSSAYSAYKAG